MENSALLIGVAAMAVSLFALLFTIFSFWWMNWRRGKLHVGAPRSYAAYGSIESKMVVEIPLVFFNSGPRPLIVQNLRLVFQDEELKTPLVFNATVDKLGTDEGRVFASQFPVRGREAKLLICEFQRAPGNRQFEARSYPLELQAKLDSGNDWKPICRFDLNVSERSVQTINRQFVVHDNMAEE